MTALPDLPIPADLARTLEDFDHAATIVEDAAFWASTSDSPDDVLAVRLALQAVMARIRIADGELVARFCTLGQEVTVDGKRYYPTTAKETERWDSEALVSRLAAVCADWNVDRDTAEILPPAVFAEKIVNACAKVLGGLAPSTKWRTSYLAQIGITNAAKYRTFERGAPKIGEQ